MSERLILEARLARNLIATALVTAQRLNDDARSKVAAAKAEHDRLVKQQQDTDDEILKLMTRDEALERVCTAFGDTGDVPVPLPQGNILDSFVESALDSSEEVAAQINIGRRIPGWFGRPSSPEPNGERASAETAVGSIEFTPPKTVTDLCRQHFRSKPGRNFTAAELASAVWQHHPEVRVNYDLKRLQATAKQTMYREEVEGLADRSNSTRGVAFKARVPINRTGPAAGN